MLCCTKVGSEDTSILLAMIMIYICTLAAALLAACFLNSYRKQWWKKRKTAVRTLIVLGSGTSILQQGCVQLSPPRSCTCSHHSNMRLGQAGGHTAEMLALLQAMDAKKYSPRQYVVAATDRMGVKKAKAFEDTLRQERVLVVIQQMRIASSTSSLSSDYLTG